MNSFFPLQYSLAEAPFFPNFNLTPENYRYVFQSYATYWEATATKVHYLLAQSLLHSTAVEALYHTSLLLSSSPDPFFLRFTLQTIREKHLFCAHYYEILQQEALYLEGIARAFSLLPGIFSSLSQYFSLPSYDLTAMFFTLSEYQFTIAISIGNLRGIQEKTRGMLSVINSTLSPQEEAPPPLPITHTHPDHPPGIRGPIHRTPPGIFPKHS
jgi:hypothetical protein